MAKTIFAIATALLAVMTVFAPAAEACISCSYVSKVAHSPSKSYSAKRNKKKRFYKAAKKRKARPAKKRIVKKKTIAKKVKTAKTAPIKTETENENSTISTALLGKDETVETEAEQKDGPKDKPKITANLGCKKFFPTVGMTLTVACVETEAEPKHEPKDKPKITTNLGCRKFFPAIGKTLTVACE